MKKTLIAASFALFAISCMTGQSKTKNKANAEVQVNIDLNKINDDKLMVTVMPTKVSEDVITFNIPKTVPGTYSTDNYGK